MNVSSIADAVNRLKASPPDEIGLSRKSPTTAPRGLVNTNAVQNSVVRDILDQKWAVTTNASRELNATAPPK